MQLFNSLNKCDWVLLAIWDDKKISLNSTYFWIGLLEFIRKWSELALINIDELELIP